MGDKLFGVDPISDEKLQFHYQNKTNSNTHSGSLESKLLKQDSYEGSLVDCFEPLSLDRNSTNQSHDVTRSSSASRLTDDEKFRALSDESNSATSSNEDIEVKRYSKGDDDDLLFSNSTTESEHTSSNTNICPNCQNHSSYSHEQKQSASSSNASRDYYVDDLCNDLLNEIIPPKSEKDTKVIIMHMMDEKQTAKELADYLGEKYGCRAAPIETISPLYRLCGPQSLAGAQKWADILVIIISPSWIRAIKDVQPTHEKDKETARYHYMLLQADFLQCCCINHRIVPVVTPGTEPDMYWDINEIKDPYTLDDIKEDFENIVEFKKWSKRGKEIIANFSRKQ